MPKLQTTRFGRLGCAMPDNPLTLAQILWEERAALAGQPPFSDRAAAEQSDRIAELGGTPFLQLNDNNLAAIYRHLNADDRWALCLSGGGIRSASFALGIVQCFAANSVVSKRSMAERESILQQFEYLSTVSGGGYIGSWLSAWLYQASDLSAEGRPLAGHADQVITGLNRRLQDHSEEEPINNLRRNTHYLAPRFSGLSPDIWSDVAAIGRNLLLNWLLFFPPLLFLIVLTKALNFGFADVATTTAPASWIEGMVLASLLCILCALVFAAANRPVRRLINLPQSYFLCFDLAAFMVGALILVFVLATPKEQAEFGQSATWLASFVENYVHLNATYIPYFGGAVFGFALYFVSWFLAYFWKLFPVTPGQRPRGYRRRYTLVDLASWSAAGIAFGLLVVTGLQLYERLSEPSIETKLIIGVVAGVPWMLAARIIADVVFVVCADSIPGPDANPEYQSRAGGLYTLTQILWLLWFGPILFGSWLAQEFSTVVTSLIASVGGLSGVLGLLVGNSSKTPSVPQEIKSLRRYLTLDRLASIATGLFTLALLVCFSFVINRLFAWITGVPTTLAGHPAWWPYVIVFLAAPGALSLVAGYIININLYSLHGLYRNRLVRAFLGASRSEDARKITKNRFTDFDPADSPRLYQLWAHGVVPLRNNWRPLHVLNVALNLVSSKNLAWQERMAAPFTFSPLHAGSGSSAYPNGAFRRTYPTIGNEETYAGGDRVGLTLGTAMAISGAAVSPNMGYNSSPGVSFLMALFNVRLGWWLSNPMFDHYWARSPTFALRPFFMEMFGLTSENERWVYLSDGGHFENLGLYEMVRRRCRLIVVSDAGCDPKYDFDDLGNALRKIWIDLGVRIDFTGLDQLKKRFKRRPTPAQEQPYWAVGHIRYGDADQRESADGLILYIKAGLHGTECMDVLSYATTHKEFPHESTANQFFTESQFESYRALGYEIAYKALCEAERQRRFDATNDVVRRADIATRNINSFRADQLPQTLREAIDKLDASLKRTADSGLDVRQSGT